MKSSRYIKRFGIVIAVALVAIGALAGAALATGDDSSAVLGSGDLTWTSVTPGTFGGTLTGDAQTLNASNFSGFVVTDARGTGLGWTVTMKATQFANGTHDIHFDSLTMPSLVVQGNVGSSTAPAGLAPATSIDVEGTGGVVMARTTATGQGMGIYSFSPHKTNDVADPWQLALTADQYEGTYHSTVTTTIATGFVNP